MSEDPPVSSPLLRRFEIERVQRGRPEHLTDIVAAEEPLQIRLQYWFKGVSKTTSLAMTMRTPGHDREFAAGYLFTEGIVEQPHDIVEIRSLGMAPSNEILVALAPHVDVDTWILTRNGPLNASCGVCGKRSIEALSAIVRPIERSDSTVSAALIESLPDLLRSHQKGFEQTGGLHAAALIDFAGTLELVFEDIGRHNAMDKLIGKCFLNRQTPLRNRVLLLSSRTSFELVQKAMMSGCPVLASVGGPSSLAIEVGRRYGLTLIGFVRGARFNVYSGSWRLAAAGR